MEAQQFPAAIIDLGIKLPVRPGGFAQSASVWCGGPELPALG
jgi:hypothetical protein